MLDWFDCIGEMARLPFPMVIWRHGFYVSILCRGIVSVCISIARVDWIWRVPESINEQLNVLGYKGSFCTLMIILIILSGIYMYAMFFFCMCMGYTANGNRDAFSFVTYIAVYIVGDNIKLRTRLVDCVGYLVNNAIGYLEDDMPRMVKTPWSDKEMPFEQAAEIGTKKVIEEHSTIGIVMTTDGSFTDIPREDYVNAEERVGDVSTVLRIALTGRSNTPDMYEIMEIMGKDRIQERFEHAKKEL